MKKCRVCLSNPQVPVHLSQENKKKFFQITGVELNETKEEIVCKKCFEVLLVAFKLRQDAIEADVWFRKQEIEAEVTLEESEEDLKPELKFEVFVGEGPELIQQEEKVEKSAPKKYIPKVKEPYICYFCEQQIRRYVDLVQHMKIHKKERRHTCRCCEKLFTDKKKLDNHERLYRRRQIRGTSLVCQHCGNMYAHPKGLAMHARIHSDNMKLKCTIEGCTEAFREKRAYYRHFVNSHGIKQPCVCLDCGTSYSNHLSLRTHRRMFHSEQEMLYDCPECPEKHFLTKKTLEAHMAFKHRGERHFVCTACPKSYGNRKNLRRHLRDNHQELYLDMIRSGKLRRHCKPPEKFK